MLEIISDYNSGFKILAQLIPSCYFFIIIIRMRLVNSNVFIVRRTIAN